MTSEPIWPSAEGIIRRIDTLFAKVGLGQVLAMRLLRLPDITIATGVFFPFEAGRAQRVVREWRKQPGLERYANLFRLSRKEPITAVFV
jgi:hypothetical protein